MTNTPYSTSINTVAELQNWVGKEIGLSDWIEITQEAINDFAKVTKDEQWIHVDVERSLKESPFKRTVAHGFMVLSYGSHFAYQCFSIKEIKMGLNYGLNKVRFTSPVLVGAKLRGRISLKEYKEIPDGAQYIIDITFELEGQEKPACVAEWIGRAY